MFCSQRFLPLFLTQFLGAFNDNLLKNALIIFVTYYLATQDNINHQLLVPLAAGLFILPFFLFSALAGQLADKYDRATLTRIIKTFEIIIMLLASIGFYTNNAWFLIAVLFASGTHSAFFGPIKYALLPQHLYSNELLLGNAYIEAGTFLAILTGTITGGLLILANYGEAMVSMSLIFVAVTGYIASRYIPVSPGPAPTLHISYNLPLETIKIIKYSRMNPRVFNTILCISWFWFIGATFLTQLPNLVKNNLHSEATIVTLFLTIFSLGIGMGALICSKLLHGKIKSIYVPTAALVMSVFIIDFCFAANDSIYFNVHGLLSTQQFTHMPNSWRIMLDLLMIAICGGIYVVPLYTIMQHSSDQKFLARIIAANNIFNALFMVLSAAFMLCILALHQTIFDIFIVIAIINVIVAIFVHKELNRH